MAFFPEDVTIRGNCAADSFTIPPNQLRNEHWEAGSPLLAYKVQQQIVKEEGNGDTVNAAALRKVVHVASDVGTIRSIQFGNLNEATGDATATLNLYVNGVAVITPIVLDNTDVDPYNPREGVLLVDAADYLTDAVFEVGITINAGTGGATLPQGIYWKLVLREMAGGA